jgi:hypothetical protein
MTTNTTDSGATMPEDFRGEPISIYTREQAIEDGVLVEVSEWAGSGPNGMMQGFCVPVVMTRTLWDHVDLDADELTPWRRVARQHGESTRGRAHDVLWMASVAARRNPDSDRMPISVLMTMAGKRGRLVRKRLVLEARIDGDGVTIGFGEDF